MAQADPRYEKAAALFMELQDRICRGLEKLDGKGTFREDGWQRDGGGGGRSRVLSQGGVFEKAGVNFSSVFGQMPEAYAAQLPGDSRDFAATGISLVLHPRNPFVPTVHANFRYLTKGDKWWFGGGADLTPYYPFREDVIHFHKTWKSVCDKHATVVSYQKLKEWCDEYFFLPHRKEARGVGGIFFDYLEGEWDRLLAFVQDCGQAFLEAYGPIVERRRDEKYQDKHRFWQEYRRGRYVEFNLLYDRGTIFGLKTGGRIESILMSLPPLVRWEYDYKPEAGSKEAELYEYLQPRNWAEEPLPQPPTAAGS